MAVSCLELLQRGLRFKIQDLEFSTGHVRRHSTGDDGTSPLLHELRYAEDTTLKAEKEEELKSLLIPVKEESANVGLNLNSQ